MVKACGASVAKLVLFVVNALFWLAGVFLLGLGIWALADKNFNEIWKGLADGNLAGQLPDLKAIAVVIIVMGAVMFVFGFAGCCGACRESRCLLTIYIFLMGLVMAAQVAVAILVFVLRGKIGPAIQDEFRKSVITLVTGKVDNGGATDKNSFNQAFLPLQFNAKCCGADNYMNYFNNSIYQSQSDPPKPLCAAVPITCCERTSSATDSWAKLNYSDLVNPIACCNILSQSDEGRYKQGCFESAKDILSKFTLPIGIGLLVFAAFQIVIMFSAVCLCQAIGQDQRYE